ncbi:hypothetical protein [Thermosulfuriphilus sp.]
MREKFFFIALLIIGLSLNLGCTLSPKVQKRDMEVTQGKAYYLKECGACHRHFRPQERSPKEWEAILKRHQIRVSLTPEQFEFLKKYILNKATQN